MTLHIVWHLYANVTILPEKRTHHWYSCCATFGIQYGWSLSSRSVANIFFGECGFVIWTPSSPPLLLPSATIFVSDPLQKKAMFIFCAPGRLFLTSSPFGPEILKIVFVLGAPKHKNQNPKTWNPEPKTLNPKPLTKFPLRASTRSRPSVGKPPLRFVCSQPSVAKRHQQLMSALSVWFHEIIDKIWPTMATSNWPPWQRSTSAWPN